MSERTPGYFDAIGQATQDIHERCGADLDVLWDNGKMHVEGSHKVKIWNGLGHVESRVEHRDLLERGPAYRRFLDDLAAAARKALDLAG